MANPHGSDIQETPDWWMASDGRWYPPHLHPDYVAPAPPVAAGPPPVAEPDAHLSSAQPPVSSPPAGHLSSTVETWTPSASAPRDHASSASLASSEPSVPSMSEVPSLAERLRSAADQVGAAASGAADQVADGARDTSAASQAGLGAIGATGAAGLAAGAGPALRGNDELLGQAESALGADLAGPATTAPFDTDIEVPTSFSGAPGVDPGAPPVPGRPPAIPSRGESKAVALPNSTPASPSGDLAVPETPGLPATGASSWPSADSTGQDRQASVAHTAQVDAGPPPPLGQPHLPVPVDRSASPPVEYRSPADSAVVDAEIVDPKKPRNVLAGVLSLIGGVAALIGSFMPWGNGHLSSDGVEQIGITVDAFDSNGLGAAVCGGLLVLMGILFFTGIGNARIWKYVAMIAGAVVIGLVIYSMIDIVALSDRYAEQWVASGAAGPGDVVTTKTDVGLWTAGAGGVFGLLGGLVARAKRRDDFL